MSKKGGGELKEPTDKKGEDFDLGEVDFSMLENENKGSQERPNLSPTKFIASKVAAHHKDPYGDLLTK